MEVWTDFVDEARHHSAEAFALRHPFPALVLLRRDVLDDGFAANHFKTSSFRLPRPAGMGRPVPAPNDEDSSVPQITLGTVLLVRKRHGTAYANRVSLGRTQTNDLVLAWPGISKFHAYFTRTTTVVDRVTDAGATNGTVVNGKRLVVGMATALRDGDWLQLGPYGFRFVWPTSLHALVREPPRELRPA